MVSHSQITQILSAESKRHLFYCCTLFLPTMKDKDLINQTLISILAVLSLTPESSWKDSPTDPLVLSLSFFRYPFHFLQACVRAHDLIEEAWTCAHDISFPAPQNRLAHPSVLLMPADTCRHRGRGRQRWLRPPRSLHSMLPVWEVIPKFPCLLMFGNCGILQ